MDTKNRLYNIFWDLKKRCYNKNSQYYKNYGGRGIIVEWENAKAFYQDMKDSYIQGLELDRINNDGNYSKQNCRWATRKQQANNRRTNNIIEYMGERKTLSQWIELLGLKSSTVRQRLYVYKWDIEKCFTFKGGVSIG